MDGWMDAMRKEWMDGCSDPKMLSGKVPRAFSEGGPNLGATFRTQIWVRKCVHQQLVDTLCGPNLGATFRTQFGGQTLRLIFCGGEDVINGESESGGWMGEWMGLGRGMNGWMDGWMQGWTDGWMQGWMDGWMDGIG